jgi:hypothetical protein
MENRLLIIGFVGLLGGCSTVTINPEASKKLVTTPTYQESRSFYLWGLVGEQRVNVHEVCNGSPVKQMQSQQTFINGLLGAITLGIYAPHSVKVWCE